MTAHRLPGGRYRAVPLILAALGALVLSGCGGGANGSSEAMRVRAAVLPSYQNIAMKVGVEQGFFKKHGLDVELVDNTDVAAQHSALGRQFDIIPSSGAYVLNAGQKGLDVTIVNNQSTSDAEHPATVLATDEPITDFADLQGATIAVPLLTSYSGASLIYLMHEAGLQPSDYKLVPLTYPTQLDNFKAGKIEAALTATPFSEGLKAAGYSVNPSNIFGEAVKVASNGQVDEISPNFNLATTEWVESHPDEVKAWRAGIQDSIAWLEANPDEGKKILVEWTKMPAEMADLATPPGFQFEIDPNQFPAIWDVMTEAGLAQGDYPGDNIKVYGE